MDGEGIHSIELPRFIFIGSGALYRVAEALESLGVRRGARVLVVTGPNVWRRYGERLGVALDGYMVEVVEALDARVETGERVAERARALGASAIIGFGGGRPIDVAKYAAMKAGAVMVSVPTSPSHDGIASPFTSLKGRERPYSVRTRTPAALVADIDVIASAPLRLIRAGAGDLIAKLTAVRDWRLAHRLKGEYYGEYAAKLALLSAKHVIEYAAEIGRGAKSGVRVLVEGLISSGVAMCIAGSTRPASGSEHLFSHALDVLYPGRALHGEQVALGTIMMMYLHGGDWRRVRRALERLGLPTTARQLGIPDEVVVEALTIAHRIRPERYTILGETGLTR
ncbi:MAG: NAD(P)-dependent glycerol-1-phosphate dehydrogenase, partial [Crenarchaeota archaeon]|nr:NAD(P)-dependent glycerol-1-phosphate dehydrogenase [Thermoproteota archaeon]